jgi:DnaJ-related protein SCJ1
MFKHVILMLLTAVWAGRDYYEVLGIELEADSVEIKKAFRKLSRKHHPDKNLGDTENDIIYFEIVKAYDILFDQNKR